MAVPERRIASLTLIDFHCGEWSPPSRNPAGVFLCNLRLSGEKQQRKHTLLTVIFGGNYCSNFSFRYIMSQNMSFSEKKIGTYIWIHHSSLVRQNKLKIHSSVHTFSKE